MRKSTSLIKLVARQKPFQSDVLVAEKWAMPMYVLCGLKNKDQADQVDTYSIAEFFFREETDGIHEKISNALHKYAEYVSKKESDYFLAILSAGVNNFEDPEIFEAFYESKLLKKYGIDDFGLSKYLFHGEKGKDWYPQTLKTFEKMLEGYDIELFVKLFAITSPRNNFKANLRLALRAYELFIKKKPFERCGFMPNVLCMLNDFKNKDFVFEKDQRNGRRKITNFARGILGDKDAIVVDSWVLKAYGMSQDYIHKGIKAPHAPRITEYDFIEDHIRHLAECCDYEPRQVVAMLWHGIRTLNSPHKVTKTKKILQEVLA
jgi:hypothetical protein